MNNLFHNASNYNDSSALPGHFTRTIKAASIKRLSGEPGLVDMVLALHAGSQGFDSHRGHVSERFFWSNRPGHPHPVSSELENSGIRVAVGDCNITERRRWRPPYQTGKTVHVHAKHYQRSEDGRTAPCVCGNGSVPLSHSGNVVTRIGIHTHTHTHTHTRTRTHTHTHTHTHTVCGRTHGAPYRGHGSVPLRFGGNVVMRMGTQQQPQPT